MNDEAKKDPSAEPSADDVWPDTSGHGRDMHSENAIPRTVGEFRAAAGEPPDEADRTSEAIHDALERLKVAAHRLAATEAGDDLRAHEEAEADIWSAALAYARAPVSADARPFHVPEPGEDPVIDALVEIDMTDPKVARASVDDVPKPYTSIVLALGSRHVTAVVEGDELRMRELPDGVWHTTTIPRRERAIPQWSCPDGTDADEPTDRGFVCVHQAEADRLREEIQEARNEAATVRRAYMHERGRANLAVHTLRLLGAMAEAEQIAEHEYRGRASPSSCDPEKAGGSQ